MRSHLAPLPKQILRHIAVHGDGLGRGFRLAVADYLMPDRSCEVELQILKIDVAPAKNKQLADPKSSCGIEKSRAA